MRRIVAVLALAAMTLTGCSQAPGQQPDSPRGTPAVHQLWTSCAVEVPTPKSEDGVDAVGLPRLDGSFTPIAAVVCATQHERRADGGEDLLQVESRADDIAALVAALRLPDQPPTQNPCTTDLPLVAWFALLDGAGRWIRPGVPTDSCGKVRIEVRKAASALHLTRTSSRTLSEIESAGAAKAGCNQGWADIVSVEAGRSLAPAATNANPLASAAQVRLCVYRVPVSEQGTGKPAGEFERGGVLTPQRREAIEKALVLTVAARACTAHTNRFALLRAPDGTGGEIYVELDGCQRILVTPTSGGTIMAQGDAALIAALEQT